MLLYIIRHGDPIYNPDSLTEKGERQADAVGKRLASVDFTHIFSSPLIRAQQTARPLSVMLKKTIEIEEWASEGTLWDYFAQEFPGIGRTWCFAIPGLRTADSFAYLDNFEDLPQFEGCDRARIREGYDRFVGAANGFFARLGYAYSGRGEFTPTAPTKERIALFCHEGVSTTLVAHLTGIPVHILWQSFGITHSGVDIINFEPSANGNVYPKCLAYSDTSHLYKEGEPLLYYNRIRI